MTAKVNEGDMQTMTASGNAAVTNLERIMAHQWAQAMVTHLYNGRYVCVLCMSPSFRFASQGEVLLEDVTLHRDADRSLIIHGAVVSSHQLIRDILVDDEKLKKSLVAKYRDIGKHIYTKEPLFPWGELHQWAKKGFYALRSTQPATFVVSPPFTLIAHQNIGSGITAAGAES